MSAHQGFIHLLNAFGHVLDHASAKQAEVEAERVERSAARRHSRASAGTQRAAGFAEGGTADASCCIAKRKVKGY